MMGEKKVVISSTPHIRSNDSIERIMLDVVLALVPASLASIYFFGLRAAAVLFLTVAWCVLFEKCFQKLAKKEDTTRDLSAVVTGVLLGLSLPSSVPFWAPVVGSFFAIVVVKQLFGGLGQNFMNPALAGRAFLAIAYPAMMVRFTDPVSNPLSFEVDAVAASTPLGMLKDGGFIPASADYVNALIGNIPGSMGETSALLLLLGGIYLLYRKVINWRIPVSFIGTFAVLIFVFGREGMFTGNPLYEMLLGGLMMGAFFMATDYSSSPITPKGQLIMGFGCGLLTVVIRVFGGYPEGVAFSILLMNLAVPLIDRYTRPRVFGISKEKKGV